jgi:hypothetical protein
MNNNSVVNGYDYLTNSFPKDMPPLDKDRILGIAKSSGLENPDFTSAVNYLRANLDFIGLNFGAIFETKPAPALAVGIKFIGSTASDRKSVVRLVGLCPGCQ